VLKLLVVLVLNPVVPTWLFIAALLIASAVALGTTGAMLDSSLNGKVVTDVGNE
jgi:hypothetical protein